MTELQSKLYNSAPLKQKDSSDESEDEVVDDPVCLTAEAKQILIEKDLGKEKPRKKRFLNPLIEMGMRMDMDQTNKIDKFTEIAMIDPFKKSSLKIAISTVKAFDFFLDVYPEEIMEEVYAEVKNNNSIRPPKTVFVPEKQLLRKCMRAMVKYSKEEHSKVLFRFGLRDKKDRTFVTDLN